MDKIKKTIQTWRRNERLIRKLRKQNRSFSDMIYAEQRKEVKEMVESLVRNGIILKNCDHGKLKSWKCKEERVCRGHLKCTKCGEKRILFSHELPMLRSELNIIDKKTRTIYRKYDFYSNKRGLEGIDIPARARF